MHFYDILYIIRVFFCHDPNLHRVRVYRNVIFLENQYLFPTLCDPLPPFVLLFLCLLIIVHIMYILSLYWYINNVPPTYIRFMHFLHPFKFIPRLLILLQHLPLISVIVLGLGDPLICMIFLLL